MGALLELVGGTPVAAGGTICGTLGRLIVDPARKTVTHLSVEPTGVTLAAGRLVPVELVESSSEQIQLRCSTAEYNAFSPNEDSHLAAIPGTRPGGMGFAWLTMDSVPAGEIEMNSDENIAATDGSIGRLRGLEVDVDGYGIAALLLEIGHLRGKRSVSIPIGFVSAIDGEGIHLSLSKSQVNAF
jgi:hypothetical protein